MRRERKKMREEKREKDKGREKEGQKEGKGKEQSGKDGKSGKKKDRKRTKSKMEKHKFSPTTSQAPGFRDTKNAAVGKTAAFWLKSRAAISCRHRFTALIYEK